MGGGLEQPAALRPVRQRDRDLVVETFVAFATIGSIVWISALAVLGDAVGSSWQSWRRNLEYVDYVAAAVLLAVIAYMVVRIARNRRGDPTAVA